MIKNNLLKVKALLKIISIRMYSSAGKPIICLTVMEIN